MINVPVSVQRFLFDFLREQHWLPKHFDLVEDGFNGRFTGRVSFTHTEFNEHCSVNVGVNFDRCSYISVYSNCRRRIFSTFFNS